MIDWVNASLTSASMAVDAMTVNATNGLKEKNMPIWKMIVLSCLFGLFQFAMPVAGYFIGFALKDYISPYIPWIAFSLLTLLAIKSFVEWFKEYRKIRKDGCQICKEAENPKKIGPGTAIVQAIATSIDALCIGFVYLNLPIEEAMLIFGLIGIVTITFSFITVFLAKFLASKLEKWAGLIAAIVFLAVGLKILLEGIL
jgi:putative Mn2+ efflux pump MntP